VEAKARRQEEAKGGRRWRRRRYAKVMDLGEVQTQRAACGAKTGSSVCTSERLLPSF